MGKLVENLKEIKVIIEPEGRIIQGKRGENLAQILKRGGINLNTWCNLKGICGKCAIEIIEGRVNEKKEEEIKIWKIKNWPKTYRLACQIFLEGDIKIKIPEESIIKDFKILDRGLMIKKEIEPAIKTYQISFVHNDLVRAGSILDYLREKLNIEELKFSLSSLEGLSEFDLENDVIIYVYDGKELVRLSKGAPASPLLGLAIDLGTTTIVMEAIDLESGEILGRQTDFNHQLSFGSDILSRIAFACTSPDNLKKLQTTIIDELNQMIGKFRDGCGLEEENFMEAVVAGNATMNHLLLGLPVASLARAPFISLFSSIEPLRAKDLNLRINPEARIFIAPNIRSFVGGDISAGLMAAGLFDHPGPFAFIDLGTNGEIVVKKDDQIVVTSTAAGPAFEGGNLSCGLPAVNGAIWRAELINHELKIETVNGRPARGICGSGLIDLLAIFLQQGVIKPDGRIARGQEKIEIQADIFLTQEDIRQAQLACAALKTGFRLLLENLSLDPRQLQAIYLAGGFGQELSIENSQAIGLIPRIEKEKVIFLGNTSLAGARLLLLNNSSRKDLLSFLEKIEYISLAIEPNFQDYFLQALKFGPWP